MAFGFAPKMDKKPIRLSKKRIFIFSCDETIPDSAFCQLPGRMPPRADENYFCAVARKTNFRSALHDVDARHPSGQQAVPL